MLKFGKNEFCKHCLKQTPNFTQIIFSNFNATTVVKVSNRLLPTKGFGKQVRSARTYFAFGRQKYHKSFTKLTIKLINLDTHKPTHRILKDVEFGRVGTQRVFLHHGKM